MVQDDKALLTRLKEQGVEFVVIGGVCGVMHGVSLVTQDLDVCSRFGEPNLRRLESALKDLHPYHRLTPNKIPLLLTESQCASLKNLYLQTDLGKIDCLGDVLGVGDYEACLRQSVPFKLSYGEFRILNLDTLIRAKESAGREKDLAAVKQLRAIKERQRRIN